MLTMNIFYADDDSDDRFLFEECLRSIQVPHTLKMFENGRCLTKELENGNYECDVVFLDLNMAGLSGIDVLQSLQLPIRNYGLKVVILTTSNSPQNIRHTYELGASLFIQKPTDFKVFQKMLKEVLTEKIYAQVPENPDDFTFRLKSAL